MKKMQLLLLLMVSGTVMIANAQTNPINTCADCKLLKADKVPKKDSINLFYDEETKSIVNPGSDGLKSGFIHYFRICNINDALFTTKISASNITRIAALPPILSTFNGNLSTASMQPVSLSSFDTGDAKTVEQIKNYYFVQRFKYDFDLLTEITTQANILLSKLQTNQTPDQLKEAVNQSINVIIQKDSLLKDSLFTKKFKDAAPNEANTIATEDARIPKFTREQFHNKPGLQSIVNFLLNDLLSRGPNMITQNGFYAMLSDNEDIVDVRKAINAVKKDSIFIGKTPDIIFSIANSKCSITSSPYEIKGDYLQLNITLLKPKFSDKPDTVSKNKLNFFRTGYIKWFDVSAGFFYDNLASKSYYFSNGVPVQEIKSRDEVTIGALIHSYYVVKSYFKTGPVIGAGVSVFDTKTKYYMGWAFLFGKNNEWSFSGGYALASLPKPSNFYNQFTFTTNASTVTSSDGGATNSQSSTKTISQTGTSGTVVTYNKFQSGFFAGLTYSFLKL